MVGAFCIMHAFVTNLIPLKVKKPFTNKPTFFFFHLYITFNFANEMQLYSNMVPTSMLTMMAGLFGMLPVSGALANAWTFSSMQGCQCKRILPNNTMLVNSIVLFGHLSCLQSNSNGTMVLLYWLSVLTSI